MAGAMLDFFGPPSPQSPGQNSRDCDSDKNESGGASVDIVQVQICQSFPRQPALEHLIDSIEYRYVFEYLSYIFTNKLYQFSLRVRVLCARSYTFNPGEVKLVWTNVSITRRPGRLSLLLKPGEKPSEAGGLRFLSEGFLCPTKRGELSVTLQNPTENKVFLSAGSVVGFVILTPFVK